ncbi:class F sortase [Herbidospora mongoliensis]|uniref:class F sortase n=1 Tax=Herbidospora mongoliensis TaxID=688067 RepID=UPI000A04E2F8|nr:class F sortase [Herbidospora mongoliensis]
MTGYYPQQDPNQQPQGYVYYQQVPAAPQPEPEGRNGTQLVRLVLVIAAVAGLLTVGLGLVFILGNPEEYREPTDRVTLKNAMLPEVGRGGGPELPQAVPEAPAPLPPIAPVSPMTQPSSPKRLIIKRLNIDAPIRSVGLDKNGAIEPPPLANTNLAGWYRNGPTPGSAGPATIVGHRDTTNAPAVFNRLAEMKYGDTVEVVRQDGTVAIYTVGGIEQADKTTFPTERVYGDSDMAELRLITCGGTYNRSTRHYVDNVIVYATMTGTRLASS